MESDEILDDYRCNRLTVVRELAYATKQSGRGNRLDLALLVNGIPVATAELKNPLTGQGVEHAKEQYRADRDPTELIFSRRVVANFAVDPDLGFVTTQLRGRSTRFLPFNTGSAGPGRPGGQGNPPATEHGRYPISYLWEEIWQRDNWLDLLERFAVLSHAPALPIPAEVGVAGHPAAILPIEVREAIRAARSQSDELLAEERFAQAAEVLATVIGPAGAALGAESPTVLLLRARRAAILVIGGDFRQALPEFDALAAAYARTAGPTSKDALDCLRQSAYCRAELGHATVALRQFRQVLAHVRVTAGDASPTALDLRRTIGMLLFSEGDVTAAEAELQPLHEDLELIHRPDHEDTREVAGALARLRLTAG